MEEARKFTPRLRVLDYTGPNRHEKREAFRDHDLIVTTYGTLRSDVVELSAYEFDYAILDEAQAIKNAESQAAKAARLIKARHRLAMTGTPIENHLGDLWSVLRVVSPGLLGSWEQFRGRYAVPIEKFGDESRRAALAAHHFDVGEIEGTEADRQ
jgi:SNF2 family DNA or RNA helicase